MQSIFSYNRRERKTTLIELFIIVGILLILTSALSFSLLGFVGTWQNQTANIELHNVQNAVTAYSADNFGKTPTSLEDVESYLVGGSATLQGTYVIGTNGQVNCTSYPKVDSMKSQANIRDALVCLTNWCKFKLHIKN